MESINDKDFNLIEGFISGNLSPDEDKKFRERLETDTTLAKSYRFRIKMAKYWDEAESYETTKTKVKELLKKEKARKKKLVTFCYAAASVVILAGITVFIMQQSKPGSLKNKHLVTEKDTSTNNISPLSIDEQPKVGSQFVVPPEYTIHDTLVIRRKKDFKDTEKIYIKRLENNTVVEEYIMETGIDSVLIPLKEIQPGNYQWVIADTSFSGDFIIKEISEDSN